MSLCGGGVCFKSNALIIFFLSHFTKKNLSSINYGMLALVSTTARQSQSPYNFFLSGCRLAEEWDGRLCLNYCMLAHLCKCVIEFYEIIGQTIKLFLVWSSGQALYMAFHTFASYSFC